MRRQRGFSLVELILVIVLIGIIGGVLTMQLAPAIQSYLLVGQRANLTNQADSALRRITTEVRGAVPNSLRLVDPLTLELVPTRDGGRYRSGPDVADAAGLARYINEAEPGNTFDVLTDLRYTPVVDDLIVIGNRSPADVYGSVNVAAVQAVTASPSQAAGMHRIALKSVLQIPPGYDGGRFLVVAGAQRVVTYRCENPGPAVVTGTETGTGTLVRYTRNTFAAAALAGGTVVASKVRACAFSLHANQGGTQDSGYLQLQLTLTDKGESAPLTIGAYVSNVP